MTPLSLSKQSESFHAMLKRHASANVCTLSYQEMADISGVKSKSVVSRLIWELETLGLIQCVHYPDGRKRKRCIKIAGPNLCHHCGNIFDSAACRTAAASNPISRKLKLREKACAGLSPESAGAGTPHSPQGGAI